MNKIPQKTNSVLSTKHGQRGVTLVEVMMAVVILAILASIAANALFFPSRMIVDDTIRQIALQATTQEMEEIRAESYAAIDSGETYYTFTAAHEQLTLTRNVNDTGDEKIITVRVEDPDNKLLVELITERVD